MAFFLEIFVYFRLCGSRASDGSLCKFIARIIIFSLYINAAFIKKKFRLIIRKPLMK